MRSVPILIATTLGILIAITGYTFVYARGFSYLTNDPAACANCHIMQNHYNARLTSSHKAVAVCNDCHTPPGLVPKYLTKAINGINHSLAFTTGRFPEPLRITARNENATELACRKCHHDIVAAIDPAGEGAGREERLSCIRCHSTVGHLE
jgi:cytochrome c nitrite reductase small subunit